MDAFETNGMWWLPDNPNDKVAGILKFDPLIGATLETVGYLGSSRTFIQREETLLIHGITQDHYVTLHRAICTSRSAGNRQRESWTVEEILIGAHLSEQELRFDYMTIRYASLKKWVTLSGLVDEFDYANRQGSIIYKSLELVDTEVNGFSVKIGTRIGGHISSGESARLEEDVIVEMSFSSRLAPDEWDRKFSNLLQKFFSFALDLATYPKSIVFRSELTSVVYSNPSKTIDYFYQLREIPSVKSRKRNKTPLFYFTDVQETIDIHLKL